MTDPRSLQERDLRHLWHPCSQMKDYEDFPPIEITSAQGSIIHTEQGELIDIISSWWCKSLGHRHPQIHAAVHKQMESFEHVILANTTNKPIVELCEKLVEMCPEYQRVFFVDSGSDAVEVAMKMSLQYHRQTGNAQRQNFMSLKNGYHGETILTLATGDCGLYGEPFERLMPKIIKIEEIPYLNTREEWQKNADIDQQWKLIEAQLEPVKNTLSGIVFEPILQGAGGMFFYSPKLLQKLRAWTSENGIHLIADEILTGMGRLGHARACEIADVVPDFSVFSKGLSGGFSPLACVMTTDHIYEAFYDDYESGKAFMHSNTYCGNGIGVAASLAALNIYQQEKTFERVRRDEQFLVDCMQEVADATGCLTNVRGVGFIAAAEIKDKYQGKRLGYAVYREAVKRGLLLRPLGNTVYFLPPMNTSKELLQKTIGLTVDSLRSVLL